MSKTLSVLRSVKQPLLQVVLYVLIYETIIRNFISSGFVKMNLALGITSEYLFYLYVILSSVLLIVVYYQKANKFKYSGLLTIAFIAISFSSLMDSKTFALIVWANVIISTFLTYFVVGKLNRE
jgi:hypothetical protein